MPAGVVLWFQRGCRQARRSRANSRSGGSRRPSEDGGVRVVILGAALLGSGRSGAGGRIPAAKPPQVFTRSAARKAKRANSRGQSLQVCTRGAACVAKRANPRGQSLQVCSRSGSAASSARRRAHWPTRSRRWVREVARGRLPGPGGRSRTSSERGRLRLHTLLGVRLRAPVPRMEVFLYGSLSKLRFVKVFNAVLFYFLAVMVFPRFVPLRWRAAPSSSTGGSTSTPVSSGRPTSAGGRLPSSSWARASSAGKGRRRWSTPSGT